MFQIALCRPYKNEDKISIRCPIMTRMPFTILLISSVIVQSPPFLHLIAEKFVVHIRK